MESTGPPLPFNKTPIVIDDDSNDDDDGDIATTFGASVALATQKKKRKKGEFSPEMMTLLQDLRVEAAKRKSFLPPSRFLLFEERSTHFHTVDRFIRAQE